MRVRCIVSYSRSTARFLYSRLCSIDHWDRRRRYGVSGRMVAWMGHSGVAVIMGGQGIMPSMRQTLPELNQSLAAWSDGPRSPCPRPTLYSALCSNTAV